MEMRIFGTIIMANILVVGPHPDDQEIGMGGTIARLAHQGHNILLCDVTDGSPTPRGDRASRLVEARAALEPLHPPAGPPRLERLLLDLPNRRVEHNLAPRHALAGVIRAHQATIIFTPEPTDAHPDHRAVTRSVEDARFDAKLTKVEMPIPPGRSTIGPPIYAKWLFYYDVSHLRRVAKPDFLIDITGYEQQKLASVSTYASQFGPFPPTPAGHANFARGDAKAGEVNTGLLVNEAFPDRLLSYSAYWGSRIGSRYAEPFFTPEPLGLTSLGGLLGVG
ncbi:MAG: PIG-L family deacetylase [Phycisphaerales bacterium]